MEGRRKTHIMYDTGLNLKQLNAYLGELMSQGAMEFSPADKRYFITSRGRAFVSAFGKYRETVKMLEKAEAELAQFSTIKVGQPYVAPADRLSSPDRNQRYEF